MWGGRKGGSKGREEGRKGGRKGKTKLTFLVDTKPRQKISYQVLENKDDRKI